MDDSRKTTMLVTVRSLALQACALQLAALGNIPDEDRFRADITSVAAILRELTP